MRVGLIERFDIYRAIESRAAAKSEILKLFVLFLIKIIDNQKSKMKIIS